MTIRIALLLALLAVSACGAYATSEPNNVINKCGVGGSKCKEMIL